MAVRRIHHRHSNLRHPSSLSLSFSPSPSLPHDFELPTMAGSSDRSSSPPLLSGGHDRFRMWKSTIFLSSSKFPFKINPLQFDGFPVVHVGEACRIDGCFLMAAIAALVTTKNGRRLFSSPSSNFYMKKAACAEVMSSRDKGDASKMMLQQDFGELMGHWFLLTMEMRDVDGLVAVVTCCTIDEARYHLEAL